MITKCQEFLSDWTPLMPLPRVPVPQEPQLGLGLAAGSGGAPSIKVVTWNVLADKLFDEKSGFGLAVPALMDKDQRQWRIAEALASLFFDPNHPEPNDGADIFCLQEVDQYHRFLAPALDHIGYQGIFSRSGSSVRNFSFVSHLNK